MVTTTKLGNSRYDGFRPQARRRCSCVGCQRLFCFCAGASMHIGVTKVEGKDTLRRSRVKSPGRAKHGHIVRSTRFRRFSLHPDFSCVTMHTELLLVVCEAMTGIFARGGAIFKVESIWRLIIVVAALVNVERRLGMKGKDWFIVGTRLFGLVIMYLGFQQVMTYLTRGMLFATLDHPFFADSTSAPPWIHLVNGGLTGAFALVLLLKTDALADWCYGKEKRSNKDSDNDDEDTRQDSGASEEMDVEEPPSIKKYTP